MRQAIRLQKNAWVKQYFTARIQADPDPYRIGLRPRPYRILLVLSHMRSGSSLLTHLLNANPDVIGYGETHLTYRQPLDLKALLLRVYLRSQEFRTWRDLGNFRMHHQYVMDKILHDGRLADESLLQSPQIYCLFLIREPQRSLASLLDLKSHWGESDALSYYQNRLQTLGRYASFMNDAQRSLLLTYDQIIDRTDQVLSTLQTFLQTQIPFSEDYPVLKTTGRKGVGDSKGNITAGKIIRQQRPLTKQLSPESVSQANTTYQAMLYALSSRCSAIPQEPPTPKIPEFPG